MEWQWRVLDELARASGSMPRPYGSVADGEVDGWSDLDCELDLPAAGLALDGLDGAALWTWTDADASDTDDDRGARVHRLVLVDGRRIDLRVRGGALRTPPAPRDARVRFDLALAAARCGRGDALIGSHLLMGVLRESLVLAMRLRDRETGTAVHRHGGVHDDRAEEMRAIAALPVLDLARPHPTERAAELYGRWRQELEPDYRPDWRGLSGVLDRGIGAAI